MSDLFFYLSKILWLLLKPDSLFLILFSVALILLWVNKTKSARVLLTILLLMAWVIALFPMGGWVRHPLEQQFQTNPVLPKKIDGIIMLGGAILPRSSEQWKQIETNDLADRLIHFITLAGRYPDARLVFTGGNASIFAGGIGEADVIEQLFIDRGMDMTRLVLEKRSRNTVENVEFSKQLVKPAKDENWLLITSASHMPRSVGLFCKQNWPVIPYPVDHSTLPELTLETGFDLSLNAYGLVTALHEWMGLTAYFVTGRIDEWLPSGCSS